MWSVAVSDAWAVTATAAAGPWRIDAACLRSAWATALVAVMVIGAVEPMTWLPSVRASGVVLSASTTVGNFGAGLQIGSLRFGGSRPGAKTWVRTSSQIRLTAEAAVGPG